MREVELKGILPHPDAAIAALEAAGATLLFRGRLEDRRYDTPERSLALRDLVLRLRIYRTADRVEGHLDWKGPTQYVDGYKVREEETTTLGDPAALAVMLEQLGYVVTREIDREIVQYRVAGAVVRVERYPRLDVLAEVEGEPAAIEAAIRVLGVPRAAFTTGRLPDFVREFEARTGERAALCDRELAGDYRYAAADA
ncbi:MAG: CYTH domain-containing protein [Gemmatimonadota bacterium]|nr:CYTH domain-containing protein [Gemmatimonadota bacterium]MDQ8169613.1 CYTH domain-containing protein [Gemmatimonadota bacterium]